MLLYLIRNISFTWKDDKGEHVSLRKSISFIFYICHHIHIYMERERERRGENKTERWEREGYRKKKEEGRIDSV